MRMLVSLRILTLPRDAAGVGIASAGGEVQFALQDGLKDCAEKVAGQDCSAACLLGMDHAPQPARVFCFGRPVVPFRACWPALLPYGLGGLELEGGRNMVGDSVQYISSRFQ